jgi:hypothetical protein
MAKSLPPGSITHAGTAFTTNAVPDPFDERDFEYRPKLDPLPEHIHPPDPPQRPVLFQTGLSCTGFALATAINAVYEKIAQENPTKNPEWVSPHMLYRFARRYDEYPGEADRGSSLRGVLKGWFYHGVCRDFDWKIKAPPDVTSSKFLRKCRERPLGAYYRVNCFRLDDMQSAISELHAVVAAARVHEGWVRPRAYRPRPEDGKTACVIHRWSGARGIGGHAFAIVGYNRIGFVVQNSFGRKWGDGGFAILPYEDWLDSAFDAWVARPGVPHTPFVTGRRRNEEATNATLATGVGPDRRRLDRHVIMLTADGRLSPSGQFISTPEQLGRVISRMEEWHNAWSKQHTADGASRVPRHIVLYPQAGLTSDVASLEAAARHLNWWMNNRVYPIYLDWQTGPAETLLDELAQRLAGKMPEGGIGFDMAEQFDRLVEMTARRHCRWMWDQLKQNARDAVASSGGSQGRTGTIQLADLLGAYVREHRGECAVHLVGHGAAAILLAELLPLLQRKLRVDSLTLLAPAIRMDDFVKRLLPSAASIKQLTVFGLSQERELNDTCAAGGTRFYQKSLLYLISRGLEPHPDVGDDSGETPLLGMAKYFEDSKLRKRIRKVLPGAAFVSSPAVSPEDGRTDAIRHDDFEDDGFTMTSVVMRLLGSSKVDAFRSSAPLLGLDHAPGEATPVVSAARIVDTQPPDKPPVVTTAEARGSVPRVPPCRDGGDPPEIGDAPPGGDHTATMLRLAGYPVLPKGRKRRPEPPSTGSRAPRSRSHA